MITEAEAKDIEKKTTKEELNRFLKVIYQAEQEGKAHVQVKEDERFAEFKYPQLLGDYLVFQGLLEEGPGANMLTVFTASLSRRNACPDL